MKIDKLYTLSQFVDKFANDCELIALDHDEQLLKIIQYNDFLKHPLNKEMFVNEELNPLRQEYGDNNDFEYNKDIRTWQEAEKKVIFDDNRVYLHFDYPDCVCIKRGGVIPYGWEMSKLAEATNGELKLKNVEL